jgi:manganese efflux pump family protein
VAALVLVALSVGLDNFGAATALGLTDTGARFRLRVAVVFGLFEAAMPLLGLLLGDSVASALGGHTKLVAGLVLCLAGVYALVQDFRSEEPAEVAEREGGPSLRRLVVLGAALSIDNLAIGFALGTYHVNAFVAAAVIGVVSVSLTLAGLELGRRVGPRLGAWGERVGGVILIAVGVTVATGVL